VASIPTKRVLSGSHKLLMTFISGEDIFTSTELAVSLSSQSSRLTPISAAAFPNRTIQRILVSSDEPTKSAGDVGANGYAVALYDIKQKKKRKDFMVSNFVKVKERLTYVS